MLKFKEGDVVRIAANESCHDFGIGQMVRILNLECDSNGVPNHYKAEAVDGALPGDEWYLDDRDIEPA